MDNLAELWAYQKADMEYDRCEAELRATATYKQLVKLRRFLEEQRNAIARLTDEVEQREKAVERTREQYALASKRYKDGLAKYEAIDKSDLDEVVRFREYFEKLGTVVGNEKRDFTVVSKELTRADSRLTDMRKKVGPARSEYQELKEKYEAECAQSQGRLNELRAAAEALGKNVNAELMAKYKSVKRSTRMPLVQVKGGQCGGCMMQLSAVLARKLRESDDIIECENCGRILYQSDGE